MICETLASYLETYGALVADRARQAFEPLHVPSMDPPVSLQLKRPMLPAQAHVVTAAVKTLRHQKAVFIAAEMGTGKTQIGACTVHAHATGKPYRAIVMAPPHLVEIWRAELTAIFPDRAVDIWILERWNELFLLPRGKLARPLWLIMGETLAKSGPYWRPAALKDSQGILRCPTCGSQIRSTQKGEGNFLTMRDLEKSRKFCTAEIPQNENDYRPRKFTEDGTPIAQICGAPLWQYTSKQPVWAPAEYIHKHLKGMFDYAIFDELHEEKSATSARGNALGAIAASCRKVIGMTGTLIGGKAGHIRSLLFRLAPGSLRAEDLAWQDSMEFARRYGRVDTIITEKECNGDDNRRSNGKTRTSRQAEQPGIMPTLYGRHLIGNTVFLSLKDVAADLPLYSEHLTPVAMCPELAVPYHDMEAKLKEAVKQLLRRGSHQLLSPMLHALLAYTDYPYDWKPVGYVDAKDGSNGRFVLVTTPPTLNKNTLWPKERELLKILAAEKAQGRQSWVFCVYTSTHPVLGRLETIIRQAGYRVKVLDASKVPTRSRSKWIADNAKGIDVMISHPQPVQTGLTLLDTAAGTYNFTNLLFYETGYNPYILRQAARRSWRIGQTLPCRVYFVYYQETMQARAMNLMAQKIEAALALEGQFSAEGLAALSADGGSLAMELARSLVENIDFGDAERVWAKSGREEDAAVAVEEIQPAMEGPKPLVNAGYGLARAATRQLCLFDG
jgi:SNF2 family DNA or RNA helicase